LVGRLIVGVQKNVVASSALSITTFGNRQTRCRCGGRCGHLPGLFPMRWAIRKGETTGHFPGCSVCWKIENGLVLFS